MQTSPLPFVSDSTTGYPSPDILEKFHSDQKDDEFRYQLKCQNENSLKVSPTGGKREKSISKIQKLVNRLKRFGETDKVGVLSDITKLDFSMHLSEISDALFENGPRLKDISSLVEICSLLYCHYHEDFGKHLSESLIKSFFSCSDITVTINSIKRRSLPRLMMELILVGVCTETDGLPGIINELCESHVNEELMQLNFSVLESITRKYDSAILGELSYKEEAYQKEIGKSPQRRCNLSKKAQTALRNKLTEFYKNNAKSALILADQKVKERSTLNQQRRINKGSIDPESENKYQATLTAFNKLESCLQSIADSLRLPAVTLDFQDDSITRMSQNKNKSGGHASTIPTEDQTTQTWEDETEKDFYENVLSLSDAIPGSLLGLKEKSTKVGDTEPVMIENDSQNSSTFPSNEQIVANECKGETKCTDLSQSPSVIAPTDTEKADLIAQRNNLLDQFLMKLCQTSTGAEIDQLAMTFFYNQFNLWKSNRKKMIKFFQTTRRSDLFLLPILSRFIATIGPYCKEIQSGVVEGVLSELKDLIAIKDPMKLESKIKFIRYLGELCKFKLVPPGTVFEILKQLLDDFSHHHAEMACHLCQTCGRFLLSFSGTRLQILLDKMLKMANTRNLPVHLEIMIEDTYFHVFPSLKKSKVKKEIPILRQFIQHLIYSELEKKSDDVVLRSLRRLNWDDPDVPKWLKKTILKFGNFISYASIGNIASILCALAPGRPAFVIGCIDQLLEDIQLNLELNDFREAPKRIRQIKLFGELFNYRLFDTSVLFDHLYQLIGFGTSTTYGCGDPIMAHKVAQISSNAHLLTGTPSLNVDPPPNTSTPSVMNSRFQVIILSKEITTKDTITKEPSNKSIAKEAPTSSTPTESTALVEENVYNQLRDHSNPEDSPLDFIRIRLICILLDTCGQYFSRGSSKDKMDRFLLFFQRYVLLKGPVPMALQYVLLDTFEKIRPKTKMFTSISEIDQAITNLLTTEKLINIEAQTEMSESEISELSENESIESEYIEQSYDETDGLDLLSSADNSNELSEDEELIEEEDEITEHRRMDTSVEDQNFEIELSKLMSESLREAQMFAGPRARQSNVLEELRFPSLTKNEPIFLFLRHLWKFQIDRKHHDLSCDQHSEDGSLDNNERVRIRLVTRKGPHKFVVKSLEIPKESKLSQAVCHKETEDAEEHARLKQFVLDSVTRSHKQDIVEQQNEIRQQLFTTAPRPSPNRIETTRPRGRGTRGGFVGFNAQMTRGRVSQRLPNK